VSAHDRLLDRLLRLVRGADAEELALRGNRLAGARQKLDTLRDDRNRLQQQLQDAQRRLEAARSKVKELRKASASWKRRSQRNRRRVLSARVLQDLLQRRRSQLSFRAGAQDRTAREQKLIAASAAYRAAIESPLVSPGPLAQRIELDQLVWWVPVGSDEPSRLKRLVEKEALPYRAIVQTREVCAGGVMLDLGAHDGDTAIPRVILGDVEACYCAEPDPLNYSCLVANVVENGLRGLVLPDQVAIGASTTTARLLRTHHPRGHRVTASYESDGDAADVRVRALDDWVAGLAIDPHAISFIKSDTQGYEMQVLSGAARLLAHLHIAWQLEFAPDLMRLAGNDPREFVDLLASRFTHFVDLNVEAPGRRRRPIAELAAALEYVERQRLPHTDVVVYNAGAAERGTRQGSTI
jgi:FkbM family methyltransferase